MIEKQSREEEMQPIEKNYFSCFVFSTCKENEVSFHWLINYKRAVNKTWIGLLGSDRIGSDSGSDRIGLRIGLVSSLLVQKNYFGKSYFNNDTGGSE